MIWEMYLRNSLLLILGVWVGFTYAQGVFFKESEGKHPGESCTAGNGQSGICTEFADCPGIRETFRTNRPVLCGFTLTSPVVCCPGKTGSSNGGSSGETNLIDISPPDVDFACGKGQTKIVFNFNRRFKRASFDSVLSVALTERPPIFPIAGGRDSERNAWPWMALLGKTQNTGPISSFLNFNWFCGGVLINDQWVLTAAHCIDEIIPDVVRLGEHDYNSFADDDDHEDYGISQMVRFPNYTFPAVYHDLALLRLNKTVTLRTYISPVCLPWGREADKDLIGRTVKLTGWGDTEFRGRPSSVLQEVDVTMFPTSRCHQSYSTLRQFKITWPNGIGEETACAGWENGGRDACQGDSGGPMTYLAENGRYSLVGIISSGYGCGHKDFPGIYANLQYPPHLAWIKQVAF